MIEQDMIIEALGVARDFNVAAEARRPIGFLSTYLQASGLSAYVPGSVGERARFPPLFWSSEAKR